MQASPEHPPDQVEAPAPERRPPAAIERIRSDYARGGVQALFESAFPWREGNRVRVLVDGEAFFEPMLEAIARAERYVLLEMYLVSSGAVATRFIDALIAAAGRGLEVYALFDEFGAGGLRAGDRQRLARGGVHLAFFNPLRYGRLRRYLFRDHRKLLLLDGNLAFTGGLGLTDDFLPAPGRQAWRETVIELRGPVVGDWRVLFQAEWNRADPRLLALPRDRPDAHADGVRGRLAYAQPLIPTAINRSMVRRALSARRRVWLATAYFIPSWRLRRTLRRMARRGVDVRLLVPGHITDNPGVRYASRRYYARLLRAGVRVFEYQPRFMHAKTLLCDHWVSLGSCNFDRWNLRWNLEANQEITDAGFAARVAAMLSADFDQAREIDAEAWRGRGWRGRVLEWWFGWVESLLEREH